MEENVNKPRRKRNFIDLLPEGREAAEKNETENPKSRRYSLRSKNERRRANKEKEKKAEENNDEDHSGEEKENEDQSGEEQVDGEGGENGEKEEKENDEKENEDQSGEEKEDEDQSGEEQVDGEGGEEGEKEEGEKEEKKEEEGEGEDAEAEGGEDGEKEEGEEEEEEEEEKGEGEDAETGGGEKIENDVDALSFGRAFKMYNFRKRKATYLDDMGFIQLKKRKPLSQRKRIKTEAQEKSSNSSYKKTNEEEYELVERPMVRSGLRPRFTKVKRSHILNRHPFSHLRKKKKTTSENKSNEIEIMDEGSSSSSKTSPQEKGQIDEQEIDDERSEDEEEADVRRSGRARKVVERYAPDSASKKLPMTKSPQPTLFQRLRSTEPRSKPKKVHRYHEDDSSSSSPSSSDEETSRHRHRSLLPLRSGTNLVHSKADIDPMSIDTSITWESIGGLDHHIRSLKEMVLFPLIYPEIFDKFGITPPRGVLFYGPPGTGKTLLARALCNTCSKSGQRISFFMRKGADCLSKWVGEAERQLRLLFEQAYQMQPSIIFFDELDGLAPVRSSKQDQIHSSIVSTLLALMDGLNSRGQVIVIGATNRIDAIDPALRRPGRFDREFLFTLPTQQARKDIFSIHTKIWNPPVNPDLVEEIAKLTVGYCGADLKALSTEAALNALRRKYPQIYQTQDKLAIDVNSIVIEKQDFMFAMKNITPAAHRSSIVYAKNLPSIMEPLRRADVDNIMKMIREQVPFIQTKNSTPSNTMEQSDDLSFPFQLTKEVAYRVRFLLHGQNTMGQHDVAAALLYNLEELTIFPVDLASLIANPVVKTLEEAFVLNIKEALRKVPSIIFLEHIDKWWETASDVLKSTFITTFQDMDPTLPVLLLATSDVPMHELEPELQKFFNHSEYKLIPPDEESRRKFFFSMLQDFDKMSQPKPSPVLEKIPPVINFHPKSLSPREETKKQEREAILRELRISLRNILGKLGKDRRYQIFSRPINPDMYPNYYDVIKNPIDLSMILDKIDNHEYTTLQPFLDDIDLLVKNSLEFNKWSDVLKLSNKAYSLQDEVLSMTRKIDPELVSLCNEITEQIKANPVRQQSIEREDTPMQSEPPSTNVNMEQPMNGVRSSSRLRGIDPTIYDLPENRKKKKKKTDFKDTMESPEKENGKDEIIIDIENHEQNSHNGSISQKDDEAVEDPDPQEEKSTTVKLDKEFARQLLEKAVKTTDNYSVERLIQIKSSVYRLIYEHRNNLDKTALLHDLEKEIAKVEEEKKEKQLTDNILSE